MKAIPNKPMTKIRTLRSAETAAISPRPTAVAIPVKQLPWLRFLSVILNQPLPGVAARFLRRRR